MSVSKNTLYSVAYIGDLTVDHYVHSHEYRMGGAALNMAVWTSRLGGAPSVVSAIGKDNAGRKQRLKLTAFGVDSTHVQELRGETSSIDIMVDDAGERRYGAWNPGTLRDFHLREKDIAFLKKHDAVCVTIYPQFVHVLDELTPSMSHASHPWYIVNFGDMREFERDFSIIERTSKVADVCVFGLDEVADSAYIQLIRNLAQDTRSAMLITLASRGALYIEKASERFCQAKSVPVVDTTGAGDSFLAAFMMKYLETHDADVALRSATDLAGQVIGKLGAY